MEIKKSELMNYIRTVQGQSLDKKLPRKGLTPEGDSAHTTARNGALNLDRLRSQVMSLQDSVKGIQTQISANQAQSAFLDSLAGTQNWQEALVHFMKDQFKSEGVPHNQDFARRMKASPDSASFQRLLQSDNERLKNDLIMKEVQLENILSTGLIENQDSKQGADLVKEINQSEGVFGKLRGEQILNLLRS